MRRGGGSPAPRHRLHFFMLAVRDVVLGSSHRMKVTDRGKPWLLIFLFSLCLAVLPTSSACPRLCACYVPTEVHCTFRYLTAIPSRIPQNVERINLGYNSLVKLTETDFSGLKKLELLMLHSNEIHTVPDKTFIDLHSLQVLKMSYNQVRILQKDTFHGLKSLVRLHMDHNRIEFINPKVFYGLTSLRLVHLEGNLLRQIHPDTFVTLSYLQIFKISSIKHIYLSDNFLTSLPQDMFSYLLELESIYLHGNPWSCDCDLQWFADWVQKQQGVVKCKKDRASSSTQQCPVCANPRNSKGKNLVEIPPAELTCTKPAIDPSLKFKNITLPDEGDFTSVSPKNFIAPIGSMILNMTDQTGNQANLVCNVQRPTKMFPISFDNGGDNAILKISFSTFLTCGIDYEHIQQLWRIVALYSNSPLQLERKLLLTKVPYISYKYKQIYSENEEVFTNVETELRTEPAWLMQGEVALQLDRTATTLSTLHIRYLTDAQIILPSPDEKEDRHNWAIISRDNRTRLEHTVLIGGTVELDCQAFGQPIPVIEWILADGSKSSTQYAPPWERDKGNSVKSWSDKRADQEATTANPVALDFFYMNRVEKPRIIGGKLAAFTVPANSDAFIPCEATGNPPPTIHWTKVSSGTDVSKSKRDNRFEVFANGTLSIQNVNIQDRGQYLCVAANQHGSDRLLVTLSVVAYPPRILEGRSKVITVHSGKPVAMKCRAEGRPVPTISWILANKTYVSESSVESRQVFIQPDGTLIIKEVTVYDRGLYTCLANNPAGTDTLAVKLQVIAAPPIILEEKRQHIAGIMGKSLKIPCTAKGNPIPSLHWVIFDGTVVKPLQFINAKLFLFSNGTLHISNLVPSDSGNYECIATSSTGSERRVVNLMVEQRDTLPRIETASQKMTQLNFGDRLLLNCSATGEPKPRIIWRLPSKAVVDQVHRMGSRIHVYPNGSLFIEAVTEKDAGDYLCVARNKIGDDLILMKVIVTMKPAKIDQKQYFKKQVPYGKDFKVDCKASGSPEPEISWSLPDGTMINNVMQADDSGHRSERYILFDNGTLYFSKVGIAEEGDYTCYAQNTLGKDEMKIHITVVTAAPRITQNHKTYIKIRAGDTAVFNCDVVGEPKPKIFWLLPSSDMISTSTDRYLLQANGSLSVSKVKLLDAGEYICVARNPGGDDTKLYKLDVVSRPPLINGLYTNKTVIKATAVKHSKKQIHCWAEGTPSPQIMWIMPDNIFLTAPYYGSRITVHKNGTLEIRNVRPSDTADFICVARNDGGESVLVVQLEVLEMLRRPMFRNPFNEKIIAKPGKITVLNCSVDGNPPPEIIWILPNGTRFSGGARISRFYTGSNGTLIIYNPSRDDAGKYRCAARNKVGYIEKLIILEVGHKPTILFYPRGPVKGISGESLSLHCLSDGNPKPNTIWTVPSGYVIDRPQINGKYILLENGTLVIRETTIHDRGNYVCKTQNNAGDSSATIPVIIVAFPPRITNRPPQSIRTMVGATVQLNCMALGIPKPEITWELPDHSVLSTASRGRPSGSELLHPQGTLVIQHPKPSDSGMYKCTAKNQVGSDFTTTYIQVI
ncbi:hypothetical protein Y1Q_0024577 [Alligator mississippiensis]|uniref:Immunoglobulin superfamily member 10 n=1 Tax=Alligator mississippiensis TaxID=8496 RepID=A0A151NAZ0_ALLMI|nr:hypothetical protein Y1Q_0024577 [Alligator mississippiensis]